MALIRQQLCQIKEELNKTEVTCNQDALKIGCSKGENMTSKTCAQQNEEATPLCVILQNGSFVAEQKCTTGIWEYFD